MPDLRDIQGLVFSGYRRQPEARYHFVQFDGGKPGPWLSALLHRLTTSELAERDADTRVNVAFTARGLRRLGLAPAALATFPREFLQGMGHPERSLVLGDAGASAPEHWEFGGPTTGFDALVLSYASTPERMEAETESLEDEFDRFDLESSTVRAYLPADERSHFGFADTRSNPRIAGAPRRAGTSLWRRNRFDPKVPLGEFVLGYRNAYRHIANGPSAPILLGRARRMPPLTDAGRAMDLGRDGSFVALRKLVQDVAGFRRFTAGAGAALWPDDPAADARMSAHLVGRWPNGAPLRTQDQKEPPAGDLQRFGYREPEPLRGSCPIGAHVRRANPRDALGSSARESLGHVRAHRLIRRGRLFGPPLPTGAPDDGVERGLMFLAIVANLTRQFEFVVESWLRNPKFGGLFGERDPIVGAGEAAESFTIPGEPLPDEVTVQRFVRVRGGEYLFLPGLRALAYLAEADG